MASSLIIKASGLNTSPNQLNLPDGALSRAENIIIERNNVIEPSRGFYLYGDALTLAADRIKQLMVYQDRILRHYSNKLQYDSTGLGEFNEYTETITEPISGIRIKSVESNGNFYLTSNEGIKKISSKNELDLVNSSIESAGIQKALDLTTSLVYTNGLQSGFLPTDAAVAYRVVFNKRDRNNNLLSGSPSQRSIIYNPLSEVIIQDFLRVLLALDNITDTTTTARISAGDYLNSLKLASNASASAIRDNLIALATKIDNDILYADAGTAPIDLTAASPLGRIINTSGTVTITRNTGDFDDYLSVGSVIYLSGLTAANQEPLNGSQILTGVTASTITFTTTEADFADQDIDATVKINSGTYRAIAQPAAPSTPATNAQLVAFQNYLDSIILALQQEPPIGTITGVVISSANKTDFIDNLDVTTTSNVELNITLPDDLTTEHFIQIYRSNTTVATGVVSINDIFPDDEMQLVYEQYITAANITDKRVIIVDSTPDDFKGANLYTNPSSGEGILQSNDKPPYATDINRFRNVTFYSNTRTPYKFNMALLGVLNMIADYNNSIQPSLSIVFSSGTVNTYNFVVGVKKVQDLTVIGDTANSLNGEYFKVSTARNDKVIVFYYKTSGGTDTPPTIASNEILQRINIATGASANAVAEKTRDSLNLYPTYFTAVDSTLPKIRITNFEEGIADDIDLTNITGYTLAVITEGDGEDASINQVLLSSSISPATAVDETARSLVRVINKNSSEKLNSFYLSGATDSPGKFLLEAKNLEDNIFYIDTNNSVTGQSFNPDSSPQFQITNIDQPTNIITLSGNHGFVDGQEVVITLTDAVPSINGVFQVEVTAADKIRVPVTLTAVNANTGALSSTEFVQSAENENRVNRIYYSKFQQPEAVPIVNFFDVGAEDRAILRIFPLMDTLFVFKEDGLYRVSGEFAPFNVQLFDSSVILKADDSVAVLNNVLYGWTTQGITAVTESGSTIVTDSIDNIIGQRTSSKYPNFRTATWGIGYESDDSYTVYTVLNTDDTYATIGFRYNTQTNTWTTNNRSALCGTISNDDKMYIGAADTNYMEKERKNFDRTDYANREFSDLISNNKYSDGRLVLTNVTNYDIGDVLIQEQQVSLYQFNALLEHLDQDLGLALSLKNNDATGYLGALQAVQGDNLGTKLVQLGQRLDTDTGPADNDYEDIVEIKNFTITSISVGNTPTLQTSAAHELKTGRIVVLSGTNCNPVIDGVHEVTVTGASTFTINKKVVGAGTAGTGTTSTTDFRDLKTNFNNIVAKLNVDTGVNINKYVSSTNDSLLEVTITDINRITRALTFDKSLDFITGPVTIFKAIESVIEYTPITMGDPINLKHLREASFMFESNSFSGFTAGFATDLLPQFVEVDMLLDGKGLLGSENFGEGFFGGGSNSAPVRTYIPRNCQRCTFLRVRLVHKVAREGYALFAVSLTGRIGISSRAYK